MKLFTTFSIFALALASIDAKYYSKCEFARKMKAVGFAVSSLPDWVCLVKAESSLNSSVRGRQNPNGSYDYGIFQINDKYWCKVDRAGNDCNAKCSQFLDDPIDDDITCAKKIYSRHGYSAWYGWKKKCQGKNLKAMPEYSVNECGL